METARDLPANAHLAVVAINDATARGAVAALLETGRVSNAIVVSQGADRLMLQEMLRPDSPVIGAVTFAPETYGQRVIPLALDILAGRDVPPAVYQQHILVRPEDAAAYLAAQTSDLRELPRSRATVPATAPTPSQAEGGDAAHVSACHGQAQDTTFRCRRARSAD
jgi:hypothetical protein